MKLLSKLSTMMALMLFIGGGLHEAIVSAVVSDKISYCQMTKDFKLALKPEECDSSKSMKQLHNMQVFMGGLYKFKNAMIKSAQYLGKFPDKTKSSCMEFGNDNGYKMQIECTGKHKTDVNVYFYKHGDCDNQDNLVETLELKDGACIKTGFMGLEEGERYYKVSLPIDPKAEKWPKETKPTPGDQGRQEQGGGIPWGVVILLAIVVIVIVFAIYQCQDKKKTDGVLKKSGDEKEIMLQGKQDTGTNEGEANTMDAGPDKPQTEGKQEDDISNKGDGVVDEKAPSDPDAQNVDNSPAQQLKQPTEMN